MHLYVLLLLLLLLLLLSQVRVVEEKTTKEIYAMKVMKKNHILQQADVSLIIIIIHTYLYIIHTLCTSFLTSSN